MKEKYIMKKDMKEKIKDKMTITELADKVGVTRCYISEIVNRRRKNVGKTLVILISRELGMDIEEVFEVS